MISMSIAKKAADAHAHILQSEVCKERFLGTECESLVQRGVFTQVKKAVMDSLRPRAATYDAGTLLPEI